MRNIGMGLNDFRESRIYSESETVALDIFNLLMNKPGYLPSNPNLGMDIPSLLYRHVDTISVESLKQTMIRQCRYYQKVIYSSDFDIKFVSDGTQNKLLVFSIPTIIESTKQRLVFAMKQEGDSIAYNYGWSHEVL